MTNRFALVVATAVAAAVAAGAAEFPHALDPGRAEAGGVTLEPVAGQGAGVSGGDWYMGQPGVRVLSMKRGLVVHCGPNGGFQVVSRPLAVYPGRRYVVVAQVRTSSRRRYQVMVADGELTHELASAAVPRSGRLRPVRVRFSSGSNQRVTVAVVGDPDATVEVGTVRLAPAPTAAS